MPRIIQLNRFPFKGFQPLDVTTEGLEVSTEVGVVGDRLVAFPKGEMPTGWVRKGNFHVCANTPQLAALKAGATTEQTALILQQALGLATPPAALETHGKYSLADTQGAFVSILNLNTLRLFSKFVTGSETKIAPERFRMNIWIDDWKPFDELTLLQGYPGRQFLQMGHLLFRVDDGCERCMAPHANPETGEYDQDIVPQLKLFMAHYQPGFVYPKKPKMNHLMGILAAPLQNGRLFAGSGIAAVDKADTIFA